MPGDKAFHVEGRVIEARSNGTYQVELSNGHRLTAFVTGTVKRGSARFEPGETVKLALTPFDLSVGRILARKKDI